MWDLRKLKQVASLDSSSASQRGPGAAVTSVSFDPAGVYLAYGNGSGSVDVSVVKEWTCLATLAAHKKAVTGLAWGGEAAFLLSSSMDRTIKQHSFKA